MTNEQLEDLKSALQGMKTAKDKPWHFRLIGGGADGKPILLIQRTENGLDAAARDARSTGKDKRLAAGRIVQDDQGLLFGIDGGNFKVDSARKCLNKEVSKEKALATHKTALAGARMLADDDWDRVKPGAEPLPQGTPSLQTDDIGLHTRDQAQQTGKKASESSDKKGSDYSLFLEALDAWHHRFGAGQSVALADYDRAVLALDGIEQKANDWLSKHKKSLLESSKTKNRRDEVKDVADQVREARAKLVVLMEFARAKGDWDAEIGSMVAEDRIDRAGQLVDAMRPKAQALADLIGDTPRSQGAVQAVNDADQAIQTATTLRTQRERLVKEGARQELVDAIDHVSVAFPNGWVGFDEVDRDDAVVQRLQRAIQQVNRVFTSVFGKPKREIDTATSAIERVQREAQITRGLAGRALGLEPRVQELETLARGPFDPSQIRDLNQRFKKALVDVEAFEQDLGLRRPPDLIERARRALKDFAVSSSDAWGAPLQVVQAAVKELAKWRGGVGYDDLSDARARTDRLEVLIAKAREAGVEHVDLDNAKLVVDAIRASIRDTMLEVKYTDEELENFRAEVAKESEQARLEEEASANLWKGRAKDGLDNGRYELGKPLSEGTYGVVLLYKSTDPNDPPLVIKQDKGGAKEVDREWEVYERLGAHPNIARVMGKVTLDGEPSLVMEKISGGNGKEAMAKAHDALAQGQITSLEFWGGLQHLVRGTIRGLAHMEAKGMGHNDVKHLNVMINAETGEPLLVDMGSARDTGQKAGAGTAQFIPLDGNTTGSDRDIFSVGGIAIAGATGNAPMYGQDGVGEDQFAYFRAWEQLAQGAPPLSTGAKASKFGSVFKSFVRATHEVDPSKRPTFAQALEHPFLADPLLPENEAREAMKKIANL